MSKGERIIAISHFVASYALETYGISPAIMRVIARGVDISQFSPEHVEIKRLNDLRLEWNVAKPIKVILMPGRLTRWKGQLVLIHALALLKRRDFMCIVVGGGIESKYGYELKRVIREVGLESNISIFDTCRDMPAAYSLADLTIVPSIRPEGFGRVVIEAQAMGSLVLASDHGGARETVLDGETGWLVPPGDVEKLTFAIERALTMDEERKRDMGARAIAHIRTNFTTEMMTSKTLEVYQELGQRAS
jgi:glycosyltransferase involved in cell wall biosynthesis